MVDRLSEAAPDSGYRFRVEVLNAPEVNALAAPGGHIVIFSGLIERTATPEELAAVLAHEIQHVLRRHSTRAVLREMFLSLLIATAFGGGDLGQIVGTAQTLGSLHFARGQEEEADREGMRLLQAARIDPSAMVTMFEKLAEQSGDAPEFFRYLSTHPDTRRRIRVMEEMAREPAPPPRPLLLGVNWTTLRTACSAP
jgi:beta-barrel assembly-enhancing protease